MSSYLFSFLKNTAIASLKTRIIFFLVLSPKSTTRSTRCLPNFFPYIFQSRSSKKPSFIMKIKIFTFPCCQFNNITSRIDLFILLNFNFGMELSEGKSYLMTRISRKTFFWLERHLHICSRLTGITKTAGCPCHSAASWFLIITILSHTIWFTRLKKSCAIGWM